MNSLEPRYKCVRCGHIEWIEVGTVGKSCHKCGYRIFVKPRKEGTDRGYKILKARGNLLHPSGSNGAEFKTRLIHADTWRVG